MRVEERADGGRGVGRERRRWVVAVDGSPSSDAAVRWCAAHAGDDVEVVVVWSLSPVGELMLGLPPSDLAEWEHEVQAAAHDTWAQPLHEAGVHYRVRSKEGRPWVALQAVADEERAEMIVAGADRHRDLAHLLPARPTEHLLEHARQPVLVVPSPLPG